MAPCCPIIRHRFLRNNESDSCRSKSCTNHLQSDVMVHGAYMRVSAINVQNVDWQLPFHRYRGEISDEEIDEYVHGVK
jgi:hypothetical protein